MTAAIKFGTDGWRGVIADDFTDARAAMVVQAAAEAWAEEARAAERGAGAPRSPARPIVVGYDTRFNSRAVAEQAADILAANGWPVLLSDRAVPTPLVSFAVVARGAAGGLVVTASHNPARFNGIKLKAPFGGSVSPEFTATVEAALGRSAPRLTGAADRGRVERVDLVPAYLERLRSRVLADRRPPRPLRIVADALHGATDGLLRALVPPGWGEVRVLHEAPDPLFGGLHPEPIPPHVDALAAEVRGSRADIGLAMDGDGDRLGVVAPDGRWVSPHAVLALLTRHLVRVRGWRGEVVKGFAVGVQVDRVCARLGLQLHVTPIGFKHIATLMQSRDILLGGEESGGVGFRDHLPERDGLLSALLVLEAVVASDGGLDSLLRSLEAEAGPAVYRRRDYALHPEIGRRLVARLDAAPPERFGTRRVTRVEALDGRKYWLDDGAWVLVRASGTEPLLRIYIEGPTETEVDDLHAEAQRLVERETKEADPA
ncbi:MAG TPA: phosphoglucomutase/phosphomannomutase family protein [Methylomirabilota bacterium]|nr:phosphoglucomutase/phosphomannomutase family protein [Methylomirabilota bacterium]